MGYGWLALGVAGIHLAYLIYLLAGGYLAWRWPASVLAHLGAVGWAVLGVAFALPCPLTAAQNALRARAGQPALAGGFLDTYLRGVLYPADHQAAVQVAVAALVGVSWIGLALRLRRQRPGASP
jgi:hypothetical protein